MQAYNDKHGNEIILTGDVPAKYNVEFANNARNCKVEIGGDNKVDQLSLRIYGQNHKITIEGGCDLAGMAKLRGSGCELFIGEGTRTNGRLFMNIGEDGDSIRIGKRCLFASVKFRTSDSHSIIDIASGERINPSGSIVLEDDVWIAEDALVLKNTHVGAGSVVGARSVLSKTYPNNSLIVGVPGKVIREGVRWQKTLI